MTKKQKAKIKELKIEIKKFEKKKKELEKENKRDKIIFSEHFNKMINYLRNPSCPKCGAYVSIKQGTRKTLRGEVQRYGCKSCGFLFSQNYLDFRMRHNQETILKALELRKKGKSLAQIAKFFGNKFSRTTVFQWEKKFQEVEK